MVISNKPERHFSIFISHKNLFFHYIEGSNSQEVVCTCCNTWHSQNTEVGCRALQEKSCWFWDFSIIIADFMIFAPSLLTYLIPRVLAEMKCHNIKITTNQNNQMLVKKICCQHFRFSLYRHHTKNTPWITNLLDEKKLARKLQFYFFQIWRLLVPFLELRKWSGKKNSCNK